MQIQLKAQKRFDMQGSPGWWRSFRTHLKRERSMPLTDAALPPEGGQSSTSRINSTFPFLAPHVLGVEASRPSRWLSGVFFIASGLQSTFHQAAGMHIDICIIRQNPFAGGCLQRTACRPLRSPSTKTCNAFHAAYEEKHKMPRLLSQPPKFDCMPHKPNEV